MNAELLTHLRTQHADAHAKAESLWLRVKAAEEAARPLNEVHEKARREWMIEYDRAEALNRVLGELTPPPAQTITIEPAVAKAIVQ